MFAQVKIQIVLPIRSIRTIVEDAAIILFTMELTMLAKGDLVRKRLA